MLEKDWTNGRSDQLAVLTEDAARFLDTVIATRPIRLVNARDAFGAHAEADIGIPYIIGSLRWAAQPNRLLPAKCQAVDIYGHIVGHAFRQWVLWENLGTSERAVMLEAIVVLTDDTMLSRLLAAGPWPGTVRERSHNAVVVRPGGARDALRG